MEWRTIKLKFRKSVMSATLNLCGLKMVGSNNFTPFNPVCVWVCVETESRDKLTQKWDRELSWKEQTLLVLSLLRISGFQHENLIKIQRLFSPRNGNILLIEMNSEISVVVCHLMMLIVRQWQIKKTHT